MTTTGYRCDECLSWHDTRKQANQCSHPSKFRTIINLIAQKMNWKLEEVIVELTTTMKNMDYMVNAIGSAYILANNLGVDLSFLTDISEDIRDMEIVKTPAGKVADLGTEEIIDLSTMPGFEAPEMLPQWKTDPDTHFKMIEEKHGNYLSDSSIAEGYDNIYKVLMDRMLNVDQIQADLENKALYHQGGLQEDLAYGVWCGDLIEPKPDHFRKKPKEEPEEPKGVDFKKLLDKSKAKKNVKEFLL